MTAADTCNNPAPQDRCVLSESDVLREHCCDLLESGTADIAAAVAAVSAYASAFSAGNPTMVNPDCPEPDECLCLMRIQGEVSLAKRFIALFLEDIEYLCQQSEDSADPEERLMAQEGLAWVQACREIPEPDRYQVLALLEINLSKY